MLKYSHILKEEKERAFGIFQLSLQLRAPPGRLCAPAHAQHLRNGILQSRQGKIEHGQGKFRFFARTVYPLFSPRKPRRNARKLHQCRLRGLLSGKQRPAHHAFRQLDGRAFRIEAPPLQRAARPKIKLFGHGRSDRGRNGGLYAPPLERSRRAAARFLRRLRYKIYRRKFLQRRGYQEIGDDPGVLVRAFPPYVQGALRRVAQAIPDSQTIGIRQTPARRHRYSRTGRRPAKRV